MLVPQAIRTLARPFAWAIVMSAGLAQGSSPAPKDRDVNAAQGQSRLTTMPRDLRPGQRSETLLVGDRDGALDAVDSDDADAEATTLDCGLSGAEALATLPDTLQLTGVIRDFVGRNDHNPSENRFAHPDFEVSTGSGIWAQAPYDGGLSAGTIVHIASDELDDDEKPTFRSRGASLSGGREFIANDPGQEPSLIIDPKPYIAWRPTDTVAQVQYTSCSSAPTILTPLPAPASKEALASAIALVPCRAVVNAETFAQWYRDVPGVNVSQALTITLRRQIDPVTNRVKYTFDDRQDPHFTSLGGFYPINGELLGNGTGYACGHPLGQTNNHFTYELDTTFVYRRGCGQVFTFEGDDDLFVFVDGRLVIDLAGAHCVRRQTIDMDRLEWLVDRQPYQLKIFSAERNRCGSNLRIETNLTLRTMTPPQVSGQFD